MKLVFGVLLCAFLVSILGGCTLGYGSQKVAVLVELDRPTGLSDEALKADFEVAVTKYQAIDGLQRKYFVYTATQFGAVFLWESRGSAQTFFNEAWHADIASTYKQDATLTYFDVPAETKGGSPDAATDNGIVAIVRVGVPWYAFKALIGARMQDALRSTAPCGICTSVSAGTGSDVEIPLRQMYMSGIRYNVSRVHARSAVEALIHCGTCKSFAASSLVDSAVPFSSAEQAMSEGNIKTVFFNDSLDWQAEKLVLPSSQERS